MNILGLYIPEILGILDGDAASLSFVDWLRGQQNFYLICVLAVALVIVVIARVRRRKPDAPEGAAENAVHSAGEETRAEEDEAEVCAAITAAISAAQSGLARPAKLVVKSITRVQDTSTFWSKNEFNNL